MRTLIVSLLAAAASIALPACAQDRVPADNSMRFQLFEGHSRLGLTRWIQASGVISLNTVSRFEALAAQVPVAGLTVALDSAGGFTHIGLELGGLLRNHGVETVVGRTVIERGSGRAHLVLEGAVCGSSCTFAFFGGVRRQVSSNVGFFVHLPSRFAQMTSEGAFTLRPPTAEDIARAYEGVAQIALFFRQMGIHPEILDLQAAARFEEKRWVTAEEFRRLGFARVARLEEAGEVPWALGALGGPHLFRRQSRVEHGRRIDQETTITCFRDEGDVELEYRILLVRAGRRLTFTASQARLAAADTVLPDEAMERDGAVRIGRGGWFLGVFRLPRATLGEAARQGRLVIETSDQDRLTSMDLSPGFAEAFAEFSARCDRFPSPAFAIPDAPSATEHR